MKNTIFSLGTVGLILLAVACSSRFADYCDKSVSCSGGNDKDKDACIASARASEDIAADYDCSDQFDKMLDCSENLSCVNGKIDTTPCAAQEKALDDCEDAAKGKKNNSVSTSSSSGSVTFDAGQ